MALFAQFLFFLQVLIFITYAVGIDISVEHFTGRPLVRIPQGALEGITKTARNGRNYSAFLGIPYGKAARFEYSRPAGNWNGTRDASEFGSSCLQNSIFTFGIGGSEDCLYLNVYTPNISNRKLKNRLPVMVFIHGGAFQGGSGNLGGAKYLLSEDVILVMINYRLGLFGFLNTGQTANMGLRDQILALTWVQKNIEHFGGNPNLVTIFGESAGGASVSLLLISPLAKGLFHRAISQSGTSNSPYVLVTDPKKELRKLGIIMDCPVRNQERLVKCLKKIDGRKMLEKLEEAEKLPEFQPEDIPKFYLSVDNNLRSPAFLPDAPMNLLQRGEFAHVPWMAGVNELEGKGYLSRAKRLLNVSYTDWDTKDAYNMLYNGGCKGLAAIRQFYVGNETTQTKVAEGITDLVSDYIFIHPAKVAAVYHARKSPAYLYYFVWKSPVSFAGLSDSSDDADGLKRAAHADELQYLFDYDIYFPEIKSGSKFAPFSMFMVKIWVQFAKDGRPNVKGMSSKLSTATWRPIKANSSVNDDVEWYQLGKSSKIVKEHSILNSRMTFWNNLLQIK